MKNNLAFIILAAGLGKRMNNPNLPKVMSLLDNKPLVGHVIDSLQKLEPEKIILVVGFHQEIVKDYISGRPDKDNVYFATQSEQLGTGHAVAQAKEELSEFDGDIIIAAGDSPLIQSKTISSFIEAHKSANSAVSTLTATAPNPYGYGRILRDEKGEFIKIAEEKDANEDEKKIDEINSGIYIVNCNELFSALDKVDNNNAQKEYYLTDIIEIMKNEGKVVKAFNLADFDELQGVNSPEQLKQVEAYYRQMTGK